MEIAELTLCACPLAWLAGFTLSPFAVLRAVRTGRANWLATLPGGEGGNLLIKHSPLAPLGERGKGSGET